MNQEGKKAIQRAKKSGLVQFPAHIPGSVCTSCKYVKGDYCNHPKNEFPLPGGAAHMCCDFYDTPGMYKFNPKEGE